MSVGLEVNREEIINQVCNDISHKEFRIYIS